MAHPAVHESIQRRRSIESRSPSPVRDRASSSIIPPGQRTRNGTGGTNGHQAPRYVDYVFEPTLTAQRASHDDDDDDDDDNTPHSNPASPSPTMADVDAKALTRVQVLTPLSILLSLVALGITSVVIKPGLSEISAKHPTYWTPAPGLLLIYWAAMYLLQVGFAVLLVLSQKPETKRALANGVGVRLALANILLGVWAVLWIFNTRETFIAGEAVLGLSALILLLTSLVLSIKYKPDVRHPLDWLFIHVPIKMFLVSLVHLDLWQQLFLALEWDRGHGHAALEKSLWPSFYLFAGLGALSSLWIFATSDFTWMASSVYLHFALLYSSKPSIRDRPAPITAAIILAMALQVVAFVGSVALRRIKEANRKEIEGRIALGRNPAEEAEAARIEAEAEAAAANARAKALRDEGAQLTPAQLEEGRATAGPAATSSNLGAAPAAAPSGEIGVTRKLGAGKGSAASRK